MMERWRRQIAIAAWFFVVANGCQSSRKPRREWQPSDHQQSSVLADDSLHADAQAPVAVPLTSNALWQLHCAACHGQEGKGDGPAAPANAPMPDMTQRKWQNVRMDSYIEMVITKGRNMMPPFGSRIPPEGIRELVKHVRTLKQN